MGQIQPVMGLDLWDCPGDGEGLVPTTSALTQPSQALHLGTHGRWQAHGGWHCLAAAATCSLLSHSLASSNSQLDVSWIIKPCSTPPHVHLGACSRAVQVGPSAVAVGLAL